MHIYICTFYKTLNRITKYGLKEIMQMLFLSRSGYFSTCIEKIIELGLLVYRIAWSELGGASLLTSSRL